MNSYWLEWANNQKKENKLDGNYDTDVTIVGTGIFGLTAGYYLSKKGLRVVIIDKDSIGEKASGHTTAKITLQHNLIYDYLINTYGKEYALKYLEANEKAIYNIKKIINEENINCDFEIQDNYVYTMENGQIEKIKKEINAINRLKRRKLCRVYKQK